MRTSFPTSTIPSHTSHKQAKYLTFTSAAEALDHYGMNWIANQEPLLTQTGIDVATHKAIVRSDTRAIIGVVGKDYQPIQNNDAFSMFDVLCKKHNAQWVNAQSLFGGSKLFLQIVAGTGEVKKGDIVENRFTIFNTFDGGGSYKVFMTPYRLVCENGMKAAVKSAEIHISIRHTKNAMYRYEEALRVFGVAQQEFTHFIETSRALAQKMVTTAQVASLIREVFEVPAEQKNDEIPPAKKDKMNNVYRLFQQGKGNSGKTAYDFVNGVSEWVDHYSGRDGERETIFSMVGAGAKMKERAQQLAKTLL